MPKSNIVYALRPRRRKPLPAAQIAIETATRIVTASKPNPKAARSSAVMDDQEPSVSIRAFFVKMMHRPVSDHNRRGGAAGAAPGPDVAPPTVPGYGAGANSDEPAHGVAGAIQQRF